MVDRFPTMVLGEPGKAAKTWAVECAEDVEAGDSLKISGVNADGQPRVLKVTAQNTNARYVAIRDAKNGEFVDVVCEGIVKVKCTAACAPGTTVQGAVGAFIPEAARGGGFGCGYAISNFAVANDDGLIYFNGSAN